MYTINMINDINRTYANAGQHAQQIFIYTMNGMITKADNVPHWVGGDYMDIQIKSARATICQGLDIEEHLNHDAAQRYAYVSADFTTTYIMDKIEYAEFAHTFCTVDHESGKNGGAVKLRFKTESKKIQTYLLRKVG